MTPTSWRAPCADWVVYIAALLFAAGAVASIWLADWRWVGTAGALVFDLAVVIALTERAEQQRAAK